MSWLLRKNKLDRKDSISSISSSATRGSDDTGVPRNVAYAGEDAPERNGSAFLNRIKDMKSRWSDMLNVDDLLAAELSDARLHPEIQWSASLRRSNDLCDEEAMLVKERRKRAAKQLQRFLRLPDEEEVDERDVPIVAIGGSGGGFRAMLGLLAIFEAAKEAGMWDLVMYTGGVSGSCWALGAYYTWGEFSTKRVLAHFAKHSMHHPLSPKAMRETMKSPRGPYFLLAPLQQKHLAGLSQTLLDIYGSFVTAFLWLPTREEAQTIWKDRLPSLHREWFRWSSVAPKISRGEEPLPILTAIRHERPWKKEAWRDKENSFPENHNDKEHRKAQDSWWQWYEFTPFEFGCDELKYWIPIWAFGRPFENGRSVKSLPEHSLSSILGLCTSAPAAPMSIYLGTIQRSLPKGWIEGSIDNISGAVSHLWGAQGTKIFEGRHPVHAANEHNPLFHASPSPRPPGIENAKRIHMLDSGISNNCPTYPFLHPSRGTDVIINFDASSDVQSEAAAARNQEMGDMKGLKFTKRDHPFPKGAADAPTQAQALAATYHAAVRAGLDTSSSNSSASPTSASTHAHESEDLGTDFHTITDGPTKGTDKTGQPTRKKGKPTDSSVEEHNRREFEEAKSEDDKRRRKSQAEGWTAESIERTFGDRYAQIFDGVPTFPPYGPTPQSSELDVPSSTLSSDQQPGSPPYHTSDHNVPLATRPVALVYCPLFPNKVNPGYDPSGAAFSGSYNLKWTEEQVQTIRLTARANFKEGLECIRLVIGEAYQRRKAERLAREQTAMSHNASSSQSRLRTHDADATPSGSEPEVRPTEGLRPTSAVQAPNS